MGEAIAERTVGERYLRLRSMMAMRERDPLQFFHFGVPRLREAFGLFAAPKPIDELHARACNKGGKTLTATAFGLACATKRKTLDGVPIPQWRGRVECVQLVLDYKQQLLSVQPAYERLLGKWPHRVTKKAEAFQSITVMPLGGNPTNEEGWSVIHFLSQKNLTSGVGVRADVVLFDEPPVMSILRELRKAGHPGRRQATVIAETPTIRRQWSPLRLDYGDTARKTLRRVDRERAEVRWSLDEVADWVISPDERASLLRKYATDPLRDAREHGDYAITEGLCPFVVKGENPPMLETMLAECVPPRETVQWKITQEADGKSGRTRASKAIPVQVWEHAKVDHRYIVTIDPSSGVDDSLHDPYELQVTEFGTGDMVARCGGYLSGYMVGVLAAGIARQYNDALIDPEVNDRWGVNVVEGVHAARYGNFARERRELRPGSGEWSNEIGFHNTKKSRPEIIGAIQSWIDARRAGIRYAECLSYDVIDTLLNCILDENGKIVGAPGVHDEALIVRGQALRKTVNRAGMEIPESQRPYRTPDQELIDMVRGNGREAEVPGGRAGGLMWSDRPRT